MLPFAAILWDMHWSSYGWIAVTIIVLPVIVYVMKRIRKRLLQLKAQSLWLEEDFIP